ncbi:MAG: SDR family NAD(P)-dependent oxidoreductase [archaeon]
MKKEETMKVALISGGTSGIGKETVFTLLEEGYCVATFSRDKENVDTLKEELAKKVSPERFLAVTGDVSSSGSINDVVGQTIARFGRIDVLINNAGWGYFTDADHVDIDRFKKMVETNVIGVVDLTGKVIPHMKKQQSGLIINISSISGKRSWAQKGPYSATKWGVMGYSEGLRNEMAPYGIKVCTICPGMVNTKFFSEEELAKRTKARGQLPAMLDPKDIGRVVRLICDQDPQCSIWDITVMPFRGPEDIP